MISKTVMPFTSEIYAEEVSVQSHFMSKPPSAFPTYLVTCDVLSSKAKESVRGCAKGMSNCTIKDSSAGVHI